MNQDTSASMLRANIIGATIREARLKTNKTLEDCGGFLGVPAEVIEAYESGNELISLPELELLSYFINAPIDRFLGKWPPTQEEKNTAFQVGLLIRLRNRFIGATLRQARLSAKKGLEELASQTGIDAAILESYELGMKPIPLVELEQLSGVLNRSITEFLDQQGPPGMWNAQQRAVKDFLTLPLEMQIFVSNPSHRPYLDLAVRLSNMSVDQLRSVAEGLLEITL